KRSSKSMRNERGTASGMLADVSEEEFERIVTCRPRNNTMSHLSTEDPLAVAAVDAIHAGNVEALRQLLVDHPHLATVRLGGSVACDTSRTLLHIATDWPGHFPNAVQTVATL